MIINNEDLYKLLQSGGYVSISDLDKALTKAKAEKSHLWNSIIELDLVSDENLGKVVADFLKLPLVFLHDIAIPQATLKIIPERVAAKYKIIAYEETKDVVKVAASDPVPSAIIASIGKKAGRRVSLYYSTEKDITNSLSLYKNSLGNVIGDLIKEYTDAEGKGKEADLPVVKIVNVLIESGYNAKSSDIHIEPAKEGGLVRFRIDGVLHDKIIITSTLFERILTRVKVEAKLRTDEHMSAQDGKMKITLPEEDLDIRVSIVPAVDGESIVLRLLSSRSRQFGLADLGMNASDLEKIKTAYKKPYGMILSTGPTGCGKTTSIYSILKILNTREKNIDTIEDPVEYEIEGVNQIQVNSKTNLTFAEGLRSILRQDPDVIYVGEIRDEETAGIAINSALTGHLVLSTLHTNSAATSLPRLIDMKIEPFLVASTVNLIIGQRLVRKICSKCRVSMNINISEMSKSFDPLLIKKYFGENKELTVFHGKGCSVCAGTGYVGRVGVFEMLVMTEALKKLVTAKADSGVINKAAIEGGMTTMLEDGLLKIQQGLTTIEEVLRATSAN